MPPHLYRPGLENPLNLIIPAAMSAGVCGTGRPSTPASHILRYIGMSGNHRFAEAPPFDVHEAETLLCGGYA